MRLKGMRTLIKLIFFIVFPFFVNGQINTFHTGTNKLFLESFLDTITASVSDTNLHISIEPRLFGVSSVSNNQTSTSYLLGASLSANIRNKITFISTYDYLGGNHNSMITEYFDSLSVYPRFGTENLVHKKNCIAKF